MTIKYPQLVYLTCALSSIYVPTNIGISLVIREHTGGMKVWRRWIEHKHKHVAHLVSTHIAQCRSNTHSQWTLGVTLNSPSLTITVQQLRACECLGPSVFWAYACVYIWLFLYARALFLYKRVFSVSDDLHTLWVIKDGTKIHWTRHRVVIHEGFRGDGAEYTSTTDRTHIEFLMNMGQHSGWNSGLYFESNVTDLRWTQIV